MFARFSHKRSWQTFFIVLCCIFQIFRKIFCRIKKLSCMDFYRNLVTWSGWFMDSTLNLVITTCNKILPPPPLTSSYFSTWNNGWNINIKHQSHFNINHTFFSISYNWKKVEKNNCSFQKNLQINIRLFFHKNYIFSFIHQKGFYENKKFNFPAKLYEVRKKCQKTKLFILQRSTTLVSTIFSYELYLFFFWKWNFLFLHKRFLWIKPKPLVKNYKRCWFAINEGQI